MKSSAMTFEPYAISMIIKELLFFLEAIGKGLCLALFNFNNYTSLKEKTQICSPPGHCEFYQFPIRNQGKEVKTVLKLVRLCKHMP